MAAALTVIGTVLTLLVTLTSLVGSLRFPTLRRRIRDHATMLKELPEEVAVPLRDVLADEVAQFAAREQLRLTRPVEDLERRARRLLLIGLAVSGAGIGFAAAVLIMGRGLIPSYYFWVTGPSLIGALAAGLPGIFLKNRIRLRLRESAMINSGPAEQSTTGDAS